MIRTFVAVFALTLASVAGAWWPFSPPDGTPNADNRLEAVERHLDGMATLDAKSFDVACDGRTDDTDNLQRALNASPGRTLRIQGGRCLTGPLSVRSNTTISFAPTTILEAVPGYGANDRLLNINGASNVTIYGNGGSIRMLRGEYVTGEQRHGVFIYGGSARVSVYDLNVEDTGGDGFYVGGVPAPSRIALYNCHSANNRRQGLSITSGDGVIVQGGLYERTAGTDPQAGIDIEPNSDSTTLRGIRIYGVRTADNAGGGILIMPSAFTGDVFDVVVDGWDSENDGTGGVGGVQPAGLRLAGGTDAAWATTVTGNVTVRNSVVTGSWGSGVTIVRWDATKSPRALIDNVQLWDINRGGSATDYDRAGVMIWGATAATTTLTPVPSGNVDLRNVVLRDTRSVSSASVAVNFRNSTTEIHNVTLEDVYSDGFARDTLPDYLDYGSSIRGMANVRIAFTEPERRKIVTSGAYDLRRRWGSLVSAGASGVLSLPSAALAVGSSITIRNAGDYTTQIRPAPGEAITEYGETEGGDLVLNYAGDLVEVTAVSSIAWQVERSTKRVGRPLGLGGVAPPKRQFYVTSMPTTGSYTAGDVVWAMNPTLQGPTGARYLTLGWLRHSTGSGHVLNTDWYEMRAAFETVATGTITLSGGTGTATVRSGAVCTCTDTTANASVKCAVVTTTLTATGTGSDVIAYHCF